MENFRKVIKGKIVMLVGLEIMAVILGIYEYITLSKGQDGSFDDGMVIGFQIGLILGLGIIALIKIIQLSRALKNEKALKKLFNKENDERLKVIRSKAGMPMLLINSTIIIVAAIIAGYFNAIIFKTLIVTAYIQIMIAVGVKVYYMKKM